MGYWIWIIGFVAIIIVALAASKLQKGSFTPFTYLLIFIALALTLQFAAYYLIFGGLMG
jgi:hypothetical protein